jgi:hypothetical protein
MIVMLLVGWGCAGKSLTDQHDSPDWINSVLTAQERVEITPAMSVADRLAALRRAKEAAYRQLMATILTLRVGEHETIGTLVERRPQLQQDIESYVSRVAVVDTDQHSGAMEVRTHVEVGVELLNLLQLKSAPAPLDRNTPSTGIVRPL